MLCTKHREAVLIKRPLKSLFYQKLDWVVLWVADYPCGFSATRQIQPNCHSQLYIAVHIELIMQFNILFVLEYSKAFPLAGAPQKTGRRSRPPSSPHQAPPPPPPPPPQGLNNWAPPHLPIMGESPGQYIATLWEILFIYLFYFILGGSFGNGPSPCYLRPVAKFNNLPTTTLNPHNF